MVRHRIEDLHHVRMLQAPGQGGLGGEEAHAQIGLCAAAGCPGMAAFDGHFALAEFIQRQKDIAGGAFTEPAQHLVLADIDRQVGLGLMWRRGVREHHQS